MPLASAAAAAGASVRDRRTLRPRVLVVVLGPLVAAAAAAAAAAVRGESIVAAGAAAVAVRRWSLVAVLVGGGPNLFRRKLVATTHALLEVFPVDDPTKMLPITDLLLLPLLRVLVVERVELLRPHAVHVEPPVADEVLLVEERPVGAEEGDGVERVAPPRPDAHVEGLAAAGDVGVVTPLHAT